MTRLMRFVVLILSLPLALATTRCAHQTTAGVRPVTQSPPASDAAEPPAAAAKPPAAAAEPPAKAAHSPADAATPSTLPPPPATDAKPLLAAADREKMERRFVELERMTLHSTPPPGGASAWALEFHTLLAKLSGVDPRRMSDEDLQKEHATARDILIRRDPALLAAIKQDDACRANQQDGKQGLEHLATLQQDWHDNHGKYAAKLRDIENLDPELTLPVGKYKFKILKASKEHFRARATGTSDMAGDTWEIDEDGDLKPVKDICDQP